MKILIYSHAFAPQIGGVETYALLLARGLAARDRGNAAKVTVVTQSLRRDFDDSAMPFAIVRRPGILQLRKLIRESDVVHLAGPVIAPLVLALSHASQSSSNITATRLVARMDCFSISPQKPPVQITTCATNFPHASNATHPNPARSPA